MAALFYRGGVLEDALGPGRVLEDTFSSPFLENCLVLGSRTALFFEWLKFCRSAEKCFLDRFFFLEIDGKKILRPFFLGKHLHLCPWSLASSISVLGLGFFLCPWPWSQALCPRLHLCYFVLTLLSHLLWNAALFWEHLVLRHLQFGVTSSR